MKIFPIDDRAELEFLKKAFTHEEQIWHSEINKFSCPYHLRKAKAHLKPVHSSDPKLCRPACIEACCKEFADFCLQAVKKLVQR